MAALTTPRRNGAMLAVLLLAQLLLMSSSVRRAHGTTVLETWVMRVTAPLLSVGQWLGGGLGSVTGGAREVLATRTRNRQLEEELALLRAELARQREAVAESDRLRALLGMKAAEFPRAIAAQVVTTVLGARTRMIVVDRGSRAGVEIDHPVIAWGGAVGRVVAVAPDHAKVWLVTDPNSGVAGVIQRSRAQGMVFGRGDTTLEMRYVPTYEDVMHGDRVVTSGLDGVFPRGIGLGTVTGVQRAPDGIQTLQLVPAIDFRQLEEVLIVFHRPPVVDGPE